MRRGKLAILLPALAGLCASQAHANINIIPTYDPTWTTGPNQDPTAAADEATITNYINSTYNVNILNPITVNVDFSDINTGLGQSVTTYYSTDYATYRQALLNTTPSNAAIINANLPVGTVNPVPGNATAGVDYTSAQGRAFGLFGAPTKTVAGEPGQLFDSVIGLNIGLIQSDNYSLTAVASHELNEALGLYSELDGTNPPDGNDVSDPPAFGTTGALDFFRYSPGGARSFTNSGTAVSYFSNDGTTPIVYFNQTTGADYHDWASDVDRNIPGTVVVGPQVQDAFSTPGVSYGQGPSEVAALKDVGYNFAPNSAAVPEPSSFALLSLGLLPVGLLAARKRRTAA